MGSSKSIQLKIDQDSVVDGKKVVASEVVNLSREAFVEEFFKVIKRPVAPHIEPVLKEVIVKDITDFNDDPVQFEVKVVLDGKKLEQSPGGADYIMLWMKVSYNAETGLLSFANFMNGHCGQVDGLKRRLQLKSYLRFVKLDQPAKSPQDPFILEYWWEDYRNGQDGERMHGDEQLANLQLYIFEPTRALQNRKASFHLNKAADVATSDPLDEVLNIEALLDGWFELCKRFFRDHEKKEITETLPGEQFFAKLELQKETLGVGAHSTGGSKAEGDQTLGTFITKVDLIKDDACIILEHLWNDEVTLTETIKAETNPLKIICTRNDKGCTTIEKAWMANIQAQLDAVIAHGASGWFY